jgi:hypothetical protein
LDLGVGDYVDRDEDAVDGMIDSILKASQAGFIYTCCPNQLPRKSVLFWDNLESKIYFRTLLYSPVSGQLASAPHLFAGVEAHGGTG